MLNFPVVQPQLMSWSYFLWVELEQPLCWVPAWFDSVEHLVAQKNSGQWWRWMLDPSPQWLQGLESR